MVRVLLLLLVAYSLMASTLEDEIISIIGQEKFDQNRAILHAVFLKRDRYVQNEMVDISKVVQVLKRIGLIEEQFDRPTEQTLLFRSFSEPNLFFKNAFDAMQKVDIFDYTVSQIKKSEEEYQIAFHYASTKIADPVAITRFLRKNGMNVVHLQKVDTRWEYTIAPTLPTIDAMKLDNKLYIKQIRKPIWIDVSRYQTLIFYPSPRNHWFAKIFIYDNHLYPLAVIKKDERVKKLTVQLPKGSYYIKISDIYTMKNMKYSLKIVGR
ncbi:MULTISPECIES: hypothetical protein [unclassified Nitratiruptor]|uniref:hypothetical protein n=1 Tax=unclassified Nitratiruptor TaxID=2624044 RepID=UPI0019157AA5|nr:MULTISPECIES: hypothetical protein [unclassified Nitratiruptor]BCD60858.1 hypothetical protein NitYY0810_C1636 [Nitratiruptor sp. YY08-10]BCD64790.1 hypothetical protein NitYY0814_C1644 [Nitratiruptor sp. YY08-14]